MEIRGGQGSPNIDWRRRRLGKRARPNSALGCLGRGFAWASERRKENEGSVERKGGGGDPVAKGSGKSKGKRQAPRGQEGVGLWS